MIPKSYILGNLRGLAVKCKRASPKDALYYSKLAILELCGWIEESMDELILRCAKGYLKDSNNIEYIKKQVIKRNYAFEYEKFRFMLIRLIGLINVERIERRMNQALMAKFEATLAALKTARDAEAHTHIKGVTRTINAPSYTITQFQDVYAGLKEFERKIKRARM